MGAGDKKSDHGFVLCLLDDHLFDVLLVFAAPSGMFLSSKD